MRIFANFIGFYTIVNREWLRTFRIWKGVLLPPIMTTTLYFIIFGHVIGSRVGQMDGFPYLQFIAPGLIMTAVITNSYACTVSAVFNLKFQRDIDELLVTPMRRWVMLCGFMVSGMLRAMVIAAIVTLIALFFTHLTVYSITTIIFVVIITSAIFSLFGVINALYARSFDAISIIPTFVLTPLNYLGGVFYSLSLLPPVWRHLSLLNPIVYIIHIFRYGILGVESHNLWLAYLVMSGVFIAVFTFTLTMLNRGKGLHI